MTPLNLLEREIKRSDFIKEKIITNIKTKKEKKLMFNVINIIFNFKKNMAEIQDEVGLTRERVQEIKISDLEDLLS